MESLICFVVLLLAAVFPLNCAAAPTWPSPGDDLEDIMFLNTGYRARGFAQPVTPCSSGLGPGRIFASEMLRTAFHDMTSANIQQGSGGLDASIIFELARADNVGEGFASSVAHLANYYGPTTPMSDLLAAGTYTSVRACGGPAIPIRYGRLDATVAASAGLVPAPQNAVSIFKTQFERMGFNQTEMITIVACGHTMGRVHSQNFPQIVPAQSTPNFSLPMDSTESTFDEKVVTEYLSNTTQNPLVVGISKTNGRNVDGRVFALDNNVTVKAMANPTSFNSKCSTVFQKMLDTVANTTLPFLSTNPITAYDVKPSALKLYLVNGGQKGVFSGEIRIRTTVRPASSISQVQIVYKDRSGGSCTGCTISCKSVGTASGFDDQFVFYSFSSDINMVTSISSFRVFVTLTSGTVETYDNNGAGFPVQDVLLLQYPQSCSSSSTNLTVLAAVRSTTTATPSLKIVTKVPRTGSNPVPSLATAIATMVPSSPSTIGNYKMYKIIYSLDSTQSSTARFDISVGNSNIGFQNVADLNNTCATLAATQPSTYLGCFTDSTVARERTLTGAMMDDSDNMSIETCATFCNKFQYFGLEYGEECYCGNSRNPNSTSVAESKCSMACFGNSQQKCGGKDRLSIYQNPDYTPVVPGTYPGYAYAGCYSDTVSNRTLPIGFTVSDDMSVDFCGDHCDGSMYFGVEYGRECHCGATIASTSTKKDDGDCSMYCAGNATEPCGGQDRLNVYRKTVNTATTSATSTKTSTTTATPVGSTSAPTFAGYEYKGCYNDSVDFRTFVGQSTTSPSMNYSTCALFCQDYGYMGLEYGTECYCSSTAASAALRPNTECNMKCGGDANSYCGGRSRLTVFRNPNGPTPPGNPNNVPGFAYSGCYTDKVDSRSLDGANTFDANMTIQYCAGFCSTRGYKIMGTEYSRECFCGSAFTATAVKADQSGCNMACSGDTQQLCGGPDRLTVYTATT